MQKDKILSIIIPIYNIENFICDCIYSIENQGILEEIEIICVNDGSKDSSKEKIIHLQEKYDNIILVEQKNGGVSSARNHGVKIAHGKYTWFIDGDDYLVDGCIPFILKLLNNNPQQFPILIDIKGVAEDTHQFLQSKSFKFKKTAYRPPASPSSIILPTTIAKQYLFDCELYYGEDYYWTFLLTNEFKKCYTVSPFVYCYRTRSSSAMNNTSHEAIKKKLDSFITLYDRYNDIQKNYTINKTARKELTKRKKQCIQACLLTLISNKVSRVYAKKTIGFLKKNKLYPYSFIFENLIPKKTFKEFRINFLAFFFPIEPYFWLLYKLVNK